MNLNLLNRTEVMRWQAKRDLAPESLQREVDHLAEEYRDVESDPEPSSSECSSISNLDFASAITYSEEDGGD